MLTGPLFPIIFPLLLFRYETLRYRFDDQGVTMSYGLLWRREIYLTSARIQDIHLSRGLLERWLDLATINIQTAAGSAASEMSIVGLLEYEQVRDFLYSQMRGAGPAEPGAGPSDARAPGTEESSDETLRLLTEIRDELRELRGRGRGADA